MEKFVKVLSEKKNVKALFVDGKIYINGGQNVGHVVALPLQGQHKGCAIFGKTASQPLQYNEAMKPFMTDDEGDAFYLFYNGVSSASTHVCIIESGEILPIHHIADLLFSAELLSYLREEFGGNFEGVEFAKIALEFLARFENWKDAWGCVTRQGHAPYGVDRQVQALHEGLYGFISSRRCGIGVSAANWTTRVFPRFRAVLHEWEKSQFVEDLL